MLLQLVLFAKHKCKYNSLYSIVKIYDRIFSIKLLNIRERVLKYIDNKGISKNKFYKETGLSNGY
jgi:hypothetical protein